MFFLHITTLKICDFCVLNVKIVFFFYINGLETFDSLQGHGYQVSLEGLKVSGDPWNNISCQSFQVPCCQQILYGHVFRITLSILYTP